MGMKNNSNDDGAIADINVVPLVDIILVVLIIFMVTAPMIMKPSIAVNLPKASSGDPSAPSTLSISLATDGRILLNGGASDAEKIRAQAVAELAKNSEVQAVISADRDVPHGKVVEMIDVIKQAGVKKFAISIEKSTK
jgi:biopolymer transport protein ExbD